MRGGSPVLALSAALSVGVTAAPRPSVKAITVEAALYTTRFFDRFSNVVAEEQYTQDVVGSLPSTAIVAGPGGSRGISRRPSTEHRVLKSDFLLATLSQTSVLTPFRDTFEVDCAAVRDREERLTKLFVRPWGSALEQAQAIAEESARFNIGNLQRTINNPVLALSFLQPANLTRLAFTLDKADESAGEDVWIVKYREQARPTFVKGPRDRDLPVEGRFWIEAASGRVLRTELVITDPTIKAQITTTFRPDDQFSVDVPAEMREEYTVAGGRVSGVATYGRFRRFQVDTDEQLRQDSPPK